MIRWYILKGHEVVTVSTVEEWGQWFATADRHVATTQVGQHLVSTIFLGVDHSFGYGPPLLFETMIFDLDGDQSYQERCSTWAQAEVMHAMAVAHVSVTPPVV